MQSNSGGVVLELIFHEIMVTFQETNAKIVVSRHIDKLSILFVFPQLGMIYFILVR